MTPLVYSFKLQFNFLKWVANHRVSQTASEKAKGSTLIGPVPSRKNYIADSVLTGNCYAFGYPISIFVTLF